MTSLLYLAAAKTTSLPSWTGSIPTWLLLFIAVVAAWRVTRGGAGSAVTELTASNKTLEEALNKARAVADEQAKQIAALQSKTDVVLAVTPLLADHEKRAQERHDATLHVLEALAAKISREDEA